ncbi:MAG: repeat containing protein, partial [Cyanobacteria bacterium RYN_339]|nr:repeat containing protein [Cyanobacteria bacterium RYN_339]
RTISNPDCVAVDSGGNVWVNTFQQLFKIAPDGTQTGFTPFAAQSGSAMVVDRAGNVYVVSEHDDTLHKMTPDGHWSVLAGSNLNAAVGSGLVGSGYQDGPGAQALFRMPSDLAIDDRDVIYVADSNNSAIRKVMPDGSVSTVAGKPIYQGPSPASGSPTPIPSALLANTISPSSIALGPQGVVYATTRDNRLVAVQVDGTVKLIAGDRVLGCEPAPCPGFCPSVAPVNCHVDAVGSAARFARPRCMVIDHAGALYILDGERFGDLRIRKVV